MQSLSQRLLMFESIVATYNSIIEALARGDRFLVSFIIGAVVIAFHAKTRLQLTAPKAQEYDFIKLITLPDLVGKMKYRRLTLLYTASLELVYVIICLAQPLFPKQIGVGETTPFVGADYQGATWPLAAALSVIGLLPSVPGFDRVEQGLRSFALSLNDIPSDFFRRVARLSQTEVNQFLERDTRYRPDLDRYWRVHNLALASGSTPAAAHQAARRVVGLHLFSRWVLENNATWSEEKYVLLKDVLDVFKPGAKVMREQFNEFLGEVAGSKAVIYVMQATKIDPFRPLTADEVQAVSEFTTKLLAKSPSQIDGVLTQAEMEAYLLMPERWRDRSEEVGVTNKRLCGLFSVLSLGDEKVVSDYIHTRLGDSDAVLREMFKLMDRSKSDAASRLFNAWATATVVGFVCCLLALISFRLGLNLDPKPGRLSPLQRDLLTAATIGLAAWFSGRWALAIRNFNLERSSWVYFDQLHRFQPAQYVSIFISAYGVGFFLMTCSTFVFTLLNGDPFDLVGLQVLTFFVYPLVWAIIPATAAVGLCCLTDWVSRKENSNIYVISLAVALVVAVAAFLTHASTLSLRELIESVASERIISTLVFTSVGFLLFSASLRGYAKEQPAGAPINA